jgi:hypothetical protein
MKVEWVKDPKTSPPDPDQPYMCFRGPDGKETWLLAATDAGDGVTAADLDFEKPDSK